jgi:hypothetical protein
MRKIDRFGILFHKKCKISVSFDTSVEKTTNEKRFAKKIVEE